MAQWTSVSGPLVAQQQEVRTGAWAARATSTGVAASASKTLSSPQADLYYRMWFKFLSPPTASSTYLGRFRTAGNASILGLYVSSSGKLSYRNDVAGISRSSTQSVTTGAWHEVQVHVHTDPNNGLAGRVEVWYDGSPVADLTDSSTTTQNFGTAPIGRLQLGENATGKTFDIAFDDVVADVQKIGSSSASSTTTALMASEIEPSPTTEASPTPDPLGTPVPLESGTTTPEATATQTATPEATETATATDVPPALTDLTDPATPSTETPGTPATPTPDDAIPSTETPETEPPVAATNATPVATATEVSTASPSPTATPEAAQDAPSDASAPFASTPAADPLSRDEGTGGAADPDLGTGAEPGDALASDPAPLAIATSEPTSGSEASSTATTSGETDELAGVTTRQQRTDPGDGAVVADETALRDAGARDVPTEVSTGETAAAETDDAVETVASARGNDGQQRTKRGDGALGDPGDGEPREPASTDPVEPSPVDPAGADPSQLEERGRDAAGAKDRTANPAPALAADSDLTVPV